LRVEPVAGPRVNESERITTVFEAVIAVVGLGDTKRVFASKIGLEAVSGNAATTVTSGLLCRLLRLSRLGALCAFLFGFGILVLLLCVLFFRLDGLVLGRGFFFGLSGLLWLRFLLFRRLGFLFVLLRLLVLLRVCGSCDSEGQRQNCGTDHSY
jgi:hypothetical protein